MGSLVVVGGGGHAKVLVSVLSRTSWHVLGFTNPEQTNDILGVPYLGNDSVLPGLLASHGRCAAIVGVGKVDASPLRLGLQEKLEAMGFELPVVISPHAVVNDEVELSAGVAILDGAIVNSGCRLGRSCVVNTNSTVEHDCVLSDNVHVASGATVCGGVSIGRNCMIGAGATIVQGVRIADGCVVGAGAAVVRSIEAPGIYVGVPARRSR